MHFKTQKIKELSDEVLTELTKKTIPGGYIKRIVQNVRQGVETEAVVTMILDDNNEIVAWSYIAELTMTPGPELFPDLENDDSFLIGAYVQNKHRRKSFATQLVSMMIEVAKENKWKTKVLPNDWIGEKLYKKTGLL